MTPGILGLEFPPVSHVIEWPTLFGDGPFAVNKVILFMWISAAIVFVLLFIAGRKQSLVPTGVQNVAESTVEFVEEGIVMQTIGSDGLGFTPLLLTLFTFILTCNLWGIIPGVQMPVTARIALPAFMAILVYVIYLVVGMIKQGPLGYFKNIMFMPGVPKLMYIMLTPIELVTYLFTRPFSLAVRLFANMLAGHLLLVSFAVITQALLESTYIGAALPLALLIFLSAFEILVAFLQAYIFTILAAVYIGDALHPAH